MAVISRPCTTNLPCSLERDLQSSDMDSSLSNTDILLALETTLLDFPDEWY